jgi:alpha-N-arabinofuranosidase
MIDAGHARSASITVHVEEELGAVNKLVFGNNIPGYDNKDHINSDYGAGIWNPVSHKMSDELINLAQSAGVTVLRFNTRNYYNWKESIKKNRGRYLYGVNEFLQTAEAINAEPVFVISYFAGDEEDAADFVEYLNAPVDRDHPWAVRRAENGHPSPFNVKYFEFGNEMFGKRHKKKNITPEKYAYKYLRYRAAMKKVDPSILLGVNLHHFDQNWDYKILSIVGRNADFVIKHVYPPRTLPFKKASTYYSGKDLFKMILGSLVYYNEKQFYRDRALVNELVGENNIGFAITEYNVGLMDRSPPYRHSLGAALVNAELLRILLKPDNNILMANYWHLSNGYWGMVRSEKKNAFVARNQHEENIRYVKRPNFFVFEMYNHHFGDVLIRTDVITDGYYMNEFKRYMKIVSKKKGRESNNPGKLYNILDRMFHWSRNHDHPDSFIPYLTVSGSKKDDDSRVYLMIVNKNMNNGIYTTIKFNGFTPRRKARAWILNGPSIEATNETLQNNVKVTTKELFVEDGIIRIDFEPHSLTAIEVDRR